MLGTSHRVTRPVMVPCIPAIFRNMLPLGATKSAVSRAGSKMADCSIWSFSVPLAAAIIAGFGVWFAGRQAVMAEERMEFDKFERRWDKRWALYEATRDILAKGFDEIKSDKDIKNYELRALEAKFLLDEEMYRYLRRVRFEVNAWQTEKLRADQATDPESKEASERIWRRSFDWINAQGTEEFPERFRKFLVPPVPVRPWWYNYDTAKCAIRKVGTHLGALSRRRSASTMLA
jgi:hypothetical protein